MSLTDLTLREISEMLIKRKVAAMELLDEYLNIALRGSCISFCSDQAFEQSRKIDEIRLTSNTLSAIAGLPYSIKDNFCTEGILTSCNSRSLKSYRPDYNAAVVRNLTKHRAVLTAKSCMREFSIGKVEDSAYELRNYLVWAGTNKNVNIGAFMVGTDIGLCETFCGLWSIKPAAQLPLIKGMITATPTFERLTLQTRRADDLSFVLPYLYGNQASLLDELYTKSTAAATKVLVYNTDGFSEYIEAVLKEAGYDVASTDDASFTYQCDSVYQSILSVDFYRSLKNVGKPESKPPESPDAETAKDTLNKEEFRQNRIDGFGFETKKQIVTGAYLMSRARKKDTLRVLEKRSEFTAEIDRQLEEYDFIAAPAIYNSNFFKASALGSYSELTVPFADVFPFKVITKPEKEGLLLDMAATIEKIM